MMYDLPPQLEGTTEQQLASLRDYLVRLARELDRAGSSETAITDIVSKAANTAQKSAAKAVQDQAQSLKAIIVKNANEITEYADSLVSDLHSTYVAISDYGNYYEQIDSKVQQTARGTLENYEYKEGVKLVQSVGDLEGYMTALNGQIRRGVIFEPGSNVPTIGIAISESLSFNGTWTDPDTNTVYDRLADHQTLGLYTSKGWQFWIDGQKMGWFDSEDSMLHVANILVEDKLQLGANWMITTTNGFGLRYIGG